jgi:broad specificity phosphatase PhoE
MQLMIVRHGETLENANQIIQGQLPGVLSETGKQQIVQLAEELRAEKFDVIYSSDLQRCVDTLAAIRVYHPNTPVVLTPVIRERHCGSFQGQKLDWDFWRSLPGTDVTRKYPGGESWLDVKERMPAFLNELYSKYPDKHILIVTHGGVIQGIRSCLENRDLTEIRKELVPNASIWRETMLKPL